MSGNRLFNYPNEKLSYVQKSILKELSDLGFTEESFEKHSWFNTYAHCRAFSYLARNKKMTIDQVFAELDGLDGDQASGIVKGCTRNEVLGLTVDQINAYLKYGIAKADLQGLNVFQIEALRALSFFDLKSDHLRGMGQFKRQHFETFIFLVSVKHRKYQEAAASLQGLSSKEAFAIRYGLSKADVTGLGWRELRVLIKSRKYAGLQDPNQVAGLSDYQVKMVKELFHYGLTSELARKDLSIKTDEHADLLIRLVKECGYTVSEMFHMQQNFTLPMLCGVIDGLVSNEIADFNQYQIDALIHFRTIKNKLCADDLRGKDWFDSEEHVKALGKLLQNHFPVQEALARMDGLTGMQVSYLVQREWRREDVEGLTDIQLNALGDLSSKHRAVVSQLLRGKDWFNSKEHVEALHDLIRFYRFTVESAMKELDGLSSRRAVLLTFNCSGTSNERRFDRQKVLQLTSLQLEIIHGQSRHKYYDSLALFGTATWLKTKNQALLLGELSRVRVLMGDEFCFAIVKKASAKPNGVEELLQSIKAGKIGEKELEALADPVKPRVSWSHVPEGRGDVCSIM